MPEESIDQLRSEVEREMDMMTAVSTGGPRIQDVNDEYRARRRRIRTLLRKLGLEDPNPHIDLWAWYGKWSRDIGGYAGRRTYVSELFQPLLERLDQLEDDSLGSQLPETELPAGWPAVDGQVGQLRIRLSSAQTSEDGQAVGLLCRDIMISLAEALYQPDLHGDVGNSAVDQLNSVVDYFAEGPRNAKLRKLLKSTIDYANVVQHRRAATLAEAGLIAEATLGAVNLMRRVEAFADETN